MEVAPLKMIRVCRVEAMKSLPDATSYADGTTRMQATDAFCARIIHVFVSMRRQAVRMDRRSELIRRGSGAVRTRA
jgi:hypothetical protein